MTATVLLSIEMFSECCDEIYRFLRAPERDRPTGERVLIKHTVFGEMYPEVSDPQFAWATERWIQSTTPGEFTRFPTWNNLMRPLYRCDANGTPVRHAGFRPDLPSYVQPTPQQLAMLPSRDSMNRVPEGAENPAIYQLWRNGRPVAALPEAQP